MAKKQQLSTMDTIKGVKARRTVAPNVPQWLKGLNKAQYIEVAAFKYAESDDAELAVKVAFDGQHMATVKIGLCVTIKLFRQSNVYNDVTKRYEPLWACAVLYGYNGKLQTLNWLAQHDTYLGWGDDGKTALDWCVDYATRIVDAQDPNGFQSWDVCQVEV